MQLISTACWIGRVQLIMVKDFEQDDMLTSLENAGFLTPKHRQVTLRL